MFSWNMGEGMFSKWAIKRVCKFILKKKIGELILGDIDVDNLDVQLTKGTLKLSDLALNVDYINHKFGADSSIYIKEGSIGSLLVTMPWKSKGCEVEIEELELVLAPCSTLVHQFGSESCTSKLDGKIGNSYDKGNLDHDKSEGAGMSASIDVHEGVKTIAKLVKWLLTSFHVTVRKLIVAFDSLLLETENSTDLQRTLVLRISEIECGTCISEESTSDASATASNFLGLNRLTNFVKFEGAMLEFLYMNGEENEPLFSCAREKTLDELFYACCPSRARTPVLSGERGGVSGTLKLSIPWKNGSLDIRKVEADAYIDPIELKFQPNSIRWFLCLWDKVSNVDKMVKINADNTTTGSVYYNSASRFYSSLLSSVAPSNDKTLLQNESSSDSWSPVGKEAVPDALLPESQLISDWVPFANDNKSRKDGAVEEPDFGASVEQFFECFDGMRSSQSALGNSGVWNWTCSVFSAITAASSLASGTLQVPCEQQHVETNLKATVAGISVLFSLTDGDQQNSCQKADMGSYAHYLNSSIQDIHLVLQVCPQERNFKATVQSIDLIDCFSNGDDGIGAGVHNHSDVEGQMHIIQRIQAAVEGVLPPFSSSVKEASLKKPNGRANCQGIYRDDVVKVCLFRTSGVTQFQLTVHSTSSSNKFVGPTSFSLKMPPFAFWVNFRLINMLLALLEEIRSTFGADIANDVSRPKDFSRKKCSSTEEVNSSHPVSQTEQWTGDIYLLTARIILCFPTEDNKYSRTYSSLDQFIALDFSSPSPLSEENVRSTFPVSNASPYKRNSLESSCSLRLNMGNLDICLLTPASVSKGNLVAKKVLSARSRRGHLSLISLHWQEGSVTGPWVAKRAKNLATAEDSKGRSRRVGKGYEFASVTTAKDVEDTSNRSRKEMILSSHFFLHAYLSPVKINLSTLQYKVLHSLLQQAIGELVQNDAAKDFPVFSQTSFLVECDSAEIAVSLEMEKSVKGSMEKELFGSWHSFRLEVKKFQLLSVSNIGGIFGADFLWTAHGEGNLWGSITGVPDRQLLLISCSNTAMGRGDGDGSNVLSSKFAGSDIIHLWDPESCHDYLSLNIRCGTIVALGGRLDWFERVASFFTVPSSETEQTSDHGSKKGTSSFVFSLVDVGLSYEPYIKGLLTPDLCHSEFSFVKAEDGINSPYIACFLAASSVKLSNSKVVDEIDAEYKIVMQDFGLFLCTVTGTGKIVDVYSAEHLHKVGYVKVARDPHIGAILKIFLKDEPTWELNCSESHIVLDTCNDTTSGLIHLGSQLQQLLAPDLEESFVHLQTRWNNARKAQQNDEMRPFSSDSQPSTSQLDSSHSDIRFEPGVVNLMDEICEEEFHSDTYLDAPPSSSDSEFYIPLCETLNASESGRPLFLEENFLEFIEGYLMTDISTSSELYMQNQSSKDALETKTRSKKKVETEKVNNGWYGNSSLKIMDDHVSNVVVRTGPRQLVSEEATTSNCNKFDECGKVKGRINFKNINVCWKMYGGSDWHKFQNNVFHSSNRGGPRDKTTSIELVFSGVDFKYLMYPEGDICVSRLTLSVQDFLLNDNSHKAPWKLVLGYYQSKDHPRKSSSKALKIDLECVRPDPLTPLEEYRLRIALLPMVLHLHQSQLDFLVRFSGGKAENQASNVPQDLNERDVSSKDSSNWSVHSISKEALLPYFQKFDLWPVLIRVDYIPSRVDLAALKGGKYVELVNLVPWKGVELKLKHVHAVGVYGWSSVCETILGEWLEDISQNQIHKLLRGLAPIRSLVAVGNGAAKLVTLPVESYKKDQRVLKGMQRGVTAFLRSISLEAVGLGVHLAAGAHDVLVQAEYILTSIPPSVPWVESRKKANVRSNQPENATQGIKQAYESISDGLGKTASALVRNPLKKFQRAGTGSALAAAIQATPAAALAPATATARAVHCAFLGMRNSLDPDHKKESIEKYLGATQPREKFPADNYADGAYKPL